MEDPTNYRRKYEKALERAKEELGSGCFNKGSIEYIFPELKESEDEKIRKRLIFNFNALWQPEWGGLNVKDIIDWLEKQGEKPITIGKRQLTGKAAELAKEVTPESLEETKKKMLEEPSNWTDEDEELFTSYSNNVLDLWKKEYAEEFINWIKSLKQRLK